MTSMYRMGLDDAAGMICIWLLLSFSATVFAISVKTEQLHRAAGMPSSPRQPVTHQVLSQRRKPADDFRRRDLLPNLQRLHVDPASLWTMKGR